MYLFALKLYHTNRLMSLKGFDDPRIGLIIKGGKRLFPSKKRNRLPITKDILEKITEEEPLRVEDLKGFKVAWAGFMRMGESQAIYSQSIERMQILEQPDSRRHQLTVIIITISDPSVNKRITLNSDL